MQAKRGGFLTAIAILLVLVAIEDVLKSFGQQGPTTLTPILFWRRTMGRSSIIAKDMVPAHAWEAAAMTGQ